MDVECPLCHEKTIVPEDIIGEFHPCPACGQTVAIQRPPAKREQSNQGSQRVVFQVFRDRWSSWETLFQEAAEFATRLGSSRLISFSHSEDENDGVVTIWYWSE